MFRIKHTQLVFYIRQGTYLCIFCTIHTLHLWVLRIFVFLCTDTRLLSSNKTNTFHIPEIHLVYYYCHVGCWCYLLTFLLHVATFGSADISELAVNMKKSCCFEMLRCHSIQFRDSQASYLTLHHPGCEMVLVIREGVIMTPP